MSNTVTVPVAGVDGCKGGWIAVRQNGEVRSVAVFPTFSALLAALPGDCVIAVDMPIGLPDFTARGGRGPEALVRRLLGERQSSVFSIPSRAAVHAEPGPFGSVGEWYAAHRRASDMARATSDPPRAISIQAFGIFSRIREIDALLVAEPRLRGRVFESHPEVAFWRLNGGSAMRLPKKVKGRINPDGMAERKALLCRHGYSRGFLDAPPPRGAAEDDFLDAAAMMLIARRIVAGTAEPFPNPPANDRHGIPIAIWA